METLVKISELTDLKTINEEILKVYNPNGERMPKNLLRKFIPHLLGEIDVKDLEKALELLQKIYTSQYENHATLDSVFTTDIRAPIFNRFGRNSPEHIMSKDITKLSYEDKGKLVKKAQISLREKHEEVHRFDTNLVLKIIKSGIDNDDTSLNIPLKAISLSLASGCRPIELFTKANFEKVSTNWVNQDFVAKKRGEIVAVQKPIISISSSEFIAEVAKLRKLINSSGKTQSNIEAETNRTIKKLFNDDEMTLYSCRKIYGQLSYSIYAKNSIYGKDPSINQWLSKVLGHSEEDLTTSLHYSNYKSIEATGGPLSTSDKLAYIYNNNQPIKNLYQFEKLTNGIIPRAKVRLWWKARQDARFDS